MYPLEEPIVGVFVFICIGAILFDSLKIFRPVKLCSAVLSIAYDDNDAIVAYALNDAIVAYTLKDAIVAYTLKDAIVAYAFVIIHAVVGILFELSVITGAFVIFGVNPPNTVLLELIFVVVVELPIFNVYDA